MKSKFGKYFNVNFLLVGIKKKLNITNIIYSLLLVVILIRREER